MFHSSFFIGLANVVMAATPLIAVIAMGCSEQGLF
jgi:hypothetical protein